jgi:signal peptidase I
MIQMNKEQFREIIEIIFLAILAVGIALLIVTFVGQRTVVKGSSMMNTLHDGDQLIVYKFLYLYKKPQKGDVVVAWIPPEKRVNMSEKLYIKRIVATEGDTVEVKDKTVFLNGKPLDEPNVIKEGGIYAGLEETKIPEGYVFVMGDNRVNSQDSRELGALPLKDIKGKAVFRFWPFKDFGKVK